jgi:hypothetical protein
MSLTREQQEVLEAYGFDLLAQVEAMLRHIREYQRALQQFRGTLPPQPNAQAPVATMENHVRALRDALKEFELCLTEMEAHTAYPGPTRDLKDASEGND